MVEWEKQKKKDLLPRKIMKKTHLEPAVNTPERGLKERGLQSSNLECIDQGEK